MNNDLFEGCRRKLVSIVPDVSLVITTHFRYHGYLREAVESALKQTLRFKEIIVADDSPVKEKAECLFNEICSDNLSLIEPSGVVVKYISKECGNPQKIRNIGLQAAAGEYVVFLDGDDMLMDYFLIVTFSNIARTKADVIYTQRFIAQEGSDDLVIDESVDFDSEQIEDGNFIGITALVRRQTILACGGFDESIRKLQDWDLWLNLKRKNGKFEFVSLPCYIVRAHSNSITFTEDGGKAVAAINAKIQTEKSGQSERFQCPRCWLNIILMFDPLLHDKSLLGQALDCVACDIKPVGQYPGKVVLSIAIIGGIADSTLSEVKSTLANKAPCQFVIYTVSEGDRKVCLNNILAVNNSEVLIYISCAVTVFPGWVQELVGGIQKNLIVGPVFSPDSRSWQSIAKLDQKYFRGLPDTVGNIKVHSAFASRLLYLNRGSYKRGEFFVDYNCCALDGSLPAKIGFHDEKFAGDAYEMPEFCDRIRSVGSVALSLGVYALVGPRLSRDESLDKSKLEERVSSNIKYVEYLRSLRETRQEKFFTGIPYGTKREFSIFESRTGTTTKVELVSGKEGVSCFFKTGTKEASIRGMSKVSSMPRRGIHLLRVRLLFEVRAAKESLALNSVYGHSTAILFGSAFSAHSSVIDRAFSSNYQAQISGVDNFAMLEKSLRVAIDREKPDIVIVHQEPNWLALVVNKVCREKGIPWIFEVHDMTSLRLKETFGSQPVTERDGEKVSFEQANGVVVVTPEVMRFAMSKYKITAPWAAVPNTISNDMIVMDRKPKLDGMHLVYQGGMCTKAACPLWGYRYYLDQFRLITSQDIHVHVYCNNLFVQQLAEYFKEAESNKLLHLHEAVTFERLLSEMSQYHWGFASFSFSNCYQESIDFLNTTSPNKVWDYLAAGIPTVVHNFWNCARTVEDFGIGFECKDLRELRGMIESYRGKTTFDVGFIKLCTMENHVWKLDKLFRHILGRY